jgi:hypothetical protein
MSKVEAREAGREHQNSQNKNVDMMLNATLCTCKTCSRLWHCQRTQRIQEKTNSNVTNDAISTCMAQRTFAAVPFF